MTITVNKNDLFKVLVEVYEETNNSGATGIEISIHDNKLFLATIECGGAGCCADFDSIRGLTPNEILELP